MMILGMGDIFQFNAMKVASYFQFDGIAIIKKKTMGSALSLVAYTKELESFLLMQMKLKISNKSRFYISYTLYGLLIHI